MRDLFLRAGDRELGLFWATAVNHNVVDEFAPCPDERQAQISRWCAAGPARNFDDRFVRRAEGKLDGFPFADFHRRVIAFRSC